MLFQIVLWNGVNLGVVLVAIILKSWILKRLTLIPSTAIPTQYNHLHSK